MLNFVVTTYDAYNRLATETDARGNVKTHTHEQARGLHLGTTYTVVDGTAATANRSFTYNHLGQMTKVVDDAGVRTFGYNTFGERESDSLVVDGDTHLVTETRDTFGRSTGYTYAKNGSVQQTVSTDYGADGRIASAGFLHGGMMKQFGYEYLQGSNLLSKLTKPNGMTLTQTYETTRDLLTGMAYHRGSTLVAQRTYTYDILGRPTARNTARQGSEVNDTFSHNTRSELIEAQVNGKDYEYAYDNIGNREFSREEDKESIYEANALHQYSSITENGTETFVPQFDADGNQMLNKTDTGIWSTVYNAENRPITFTNADSGTVVECAYDSQGRRAYKKVTTNGTVTLYQRYIYRDYLQIACVDLTRSHHPCLWLITWDPSQRIATRPLAIQKDGTWYTYGLDLTKNVCEVFNTSGYIITTYTYTPYGKITANGSITQPIQLSSEYIDAEIGLVYYNWRYSNIKDGRWINRDFLSEKYDKNLYIYERNKPLFSIDIRGLRWVPLRNGKNHYKATSKFDTLASLAYKITGYKEDWSCIWPVNLKHPSHYPLTSNGTVKTCDTYDVSNLVTRVGTKYYAYLDPDREEVMNILDPSAIHTTGKNAASEIKETAKEGATPISQFFLYGHSCAGCLILSGNRWYLSDFTVDRLTNLNIHPSYNRAKERKGPIRCWFAIGTDARVQGCSTEALAKQMAQKVMRKGTTSSGTNQTTLLWINPSTEEVIMLYDRDYSTGEYYNGGSLNTKDVIVKFQGTN